MTFDAVYDYLLAHPDVSFQPGIYKLQQQMSAAGRPRRAAGPGEQDPRTRSTIPEGTAAVDVYALLGVGTGCRSRTSRRPRPTYVATACRQRRSSLEGFLFPATYEFDPGTTAAQALQTPRHRVDQAARRGRRRPRGPR